MARTMLCPHCKATLKLTNEGGDLVAEVTKPPAEPKKTDDVMDLLDPPKADDAGEEK